MMDPFETPTREFIRPNVFRHVQILQDPRTVVCVLCLRTGTCNSVEALLKGFGVQKMVKKFCAVVPQTLKTVRDVLPVLGAVHLKNGVMCNYCQPAIKLFLDEAATGDKTEIKWGLEGLRNIVDQGDMDSLREKDFEQSINSKEEKNAVKVYRQKFLDLCDKKLERLKPTMETGNQEKSTQKEESSEDEWQVDWEAKKRRKVETVPPCKKQEKAEPKPEPQEFIIDFMTRPK